jgi:hypothetical protein
VALRSGSEDVAYVVRILLVLRRCAPPSARLLFDPLIAFYADRPDTVGVDALLEPARAVGPAVTQTRRESDVRFQTRIDGPHVEQGASVTTKPCFVVRAETAQGDFAWVFANLEQRRWVRLAGRIGPMLVDQLHEAGGRPVRGRDLHALKERREDAWTNDIWNVNHHVSTINTLAFASDPSLLFIESHGEPTRRKGERRKRDRTQERPDGRWFQIRPNIWRICEIRVETLDDIETRVAARFGPPPAAPKGKSFP